MNKFLTAASLAAFLAAGGVAPALAQTDSGSHTTKIGDNCPSDVEDCLTEEGNMDSAATGTMETDPTHTGSTGAMTATDSDGVADAAGNGIGSSSPDTESEPTGMSQ